MFFVLGSTHAKEPLPQDVIISAHIRLKAGQTFKNYPSFSCLETIQRFERKSNSSPFSTVDSLRLEVAIIDGKELFSWPGERHFSEQAPKQLVAAGLTTSGEFLANVQNVLLSNNATLIYAGAEELHRTRTLKYSFALSQLVSGYRVYGHEQSARVATKGYIWVDSETLELIRLKLQAVSIPSELGVASISSRIDFAPSTLGGERVLLPDTATVTHTETNGRSSRNEIFFSHFRRYSAESALSFSEAPAHLNASQKRNSPETYLPAGLTIPLLLTNSLDVNRARLGDPIEAVLLSDLKTKSSVLFPMGSTVTGRVRLAEFLQTPKPHFLLGLEFTNIASSQRQSLVLAYLTSYTNLAGIDNSLRTESTQNRSLLNNGRLTVTEAETTSPLKLPGVGSFVVTGRRVIIPAGFQMDWISLKPSKREHPRR